MRNSEYKGRNTVYKTKKRIFTVAISFMLFTVFLLTNLFKLQVLSHGYYKNKVYEEITTTSPLRAARGNIYDTNMTPLATTSTQWRIFISTKELKLAKTKTGIDYTKIISNGLSSILGINKDIIREKIEKSTVLDVTIKKSANEEEYRKTLDFIKKNSLQNLVFTEAQSSRYYPEGSLLAHVLGFTGSDNQGLYGLEYQYDSVLKGKDGYYLYAKDANGKELDTEYSTYVPAENGYSLVTTIDAYVQKALEGELEKILRNHDVQNRVTGIVMDTNTGAILAMATSSPFDPNSPYELDKNSEKKLAESGYAPGSDQYNAYKRELMSIMWSNKAVSETYEPGSTFKIITVSTALDAGVAESDDCFSCHGYYEVGGWHIKCHKTTGHGSGFSLAYGLQMSCNPTMMQIAERIGVSKFYDYIDSFGYFEKSGIDLPSEARTIFHKEENIGATELATISFGQRFKVSIINHLTAIAAVANGGTLLTPYVVEKVIDEAGNIVSEHKTEVKKQVISESVANLVSQILEEGVSGEGGAKNARVDGYKVAAKTGTSQKFDILDENGNSYLRIGSTVAYSPSDNSGIAVIIVVDEPTTAVKYGSVVAAPYVSSLLENILPYLEYESNAEKINIPVDDYVGMSRADAEQALKNTNISYEIVGNGEYIIAQTPGKNEIITSTRSKIILYTKKEEELVCVPKLVGMKIEDAVLICINSGLNIHIRGSTVGGTVESQSLPLGALVKRGEVITLNAIALDFSD